MKSAWKDHRNFLTKLTRKRLVNSMRILGSYYQSRLTGKEAIRGLPISLSIEPTTSCNLRCPECPSGLRSFSRPTGMLADETFEKIISELSPSLIYLILYFQGEPFLHPHFFDFVNFAADHNIYTATSTNAHYLDPENAMKTVNSGLDRLIVSIDGTTQDTYEKYRIGGSLEKVKDGLENIVRCKRDTLSSTPHLILQFIVFGHNEHQIEDMREWGYKIGVDEVTLKTAQIYDFEKGSDLIPETEKYARYSKNGDGTWNIKNELLSHCWKMWHSSVITWDGNVVPCCFDKDASHVLGKLSEQSFTDIWFGQAYSNFRVSLLKSRESIDICKNCSEGTKVFA